MSPNISTYALKKYRPLDSIEAKKGAMVAVKVTDMLSEEVLVVRGA